MLVWRVAQPAGRVAARSFTSTAEAREALAVVREGERRLDRNRDGTMRLNFAIVGPEEAETVHRLLYATYYPGEPLISHLGLCTGPHSIAELDTAVEHRLAKNLTLVAYDDSGRPVGAAVNNVCTREEVMVGLEEELEGVEESYRPITAIHHQLRVQNVAAFDEIGIEKIFDIGMIGVERTGLGISTNLIRRSVLLAGCLGFRGIKTEATGTFSREAFERVGFHPAGSVQYADFEFQGRRVFAGMEGSDTGVTFMKKKFFQSSLTHIL